MYYHVSTPFSNTPGKKDENSDLSMLSMSYQSPLLSLCTNATQTLVSDLNRSVVKTTSNSFQRSSEGFSSLSNQYQKLISVMCFEVMDFTCSRTCPNQVSDTVKSNFDRDLWDSRDTKPPLADNAGCRKFPNHITLGYTRGFRYSDLSPEVPLFQALTAIVQQGLNTFHGQTNI